MAIIYTKVWASRPFLRVYVFPGLWWHQTGNDWNTILIVISNEALIGVGSIRTHHSICFVWCLGRFIIRDDYFVSRLDVEARVLVSCIDSLQTSRSLIHATWGIRLILVHWTISVLSRKIALTAWPMTKLLDLGFFICLRWCLKKLAFDRCEPLYRICSQPWDASSSQSR